MAKQIIIWGRPRYREPRGVCIDRRSVGTVWIEGVPYTYNPELVKNNRIDFEYYNNRGRTRRPKRRIYVRRR